MRLVVHTDGSCDDTLFQYRNRVSPHAAAEEEDDYVDEDVSFNTAIGYPPHAACVV